MATTGEDTRAQRVGRSSQRRGRRREPPQLYGVEARDRVSPPEPAGVASEGPEPARRLDLVTGLEQAQPCCRVTADGADPPAAPRTPAVDAGGAHGGPGVVEPTPPGRRERCGQRGGGARTGPGP